MTTLVAVERYSEKHPIRLGAVQALSACVEDERANRGLFVTTSRYLPSVQKFAGRQNNRIQLATSRHVAEWCEFARSRIIRDKSKLISDEHVELILEPDGRRQSCGFGTGQGRHLRFAGDPLRLTDRRREKRE